MPIDYDKYPPDWKTRIVPAVRERSGGRCEGDAVTGYDGPGERCNAPNGARIIRNPLGPGEWREQKVNEVGVQVVLTVAHLDRDPENHGVELDRLRDLCQRCHLRYDKDANAASVRETAYKKRAGKGGQGLLFEEG